MRTSLLVLAIAGLGSLLCAGCSIGQPERKSPKPLMIVQFKASNTSINNRVVLRQKLVNALRTPVERPIVLLVAAGNDEDDFSLAATRLHSFIEAIGPTVDADYKLLVKPSERTEMSNNILVYVTDSWDEKIKSFAYNADFSKVDGAGDIYRASDKRLFIARATSRTISSSGVDQYSQLSGFVSELCWNVDLSANSNPLSESEKIFISGINVVTNESCATTQEISLFMDAYLSKYLSGFSYKTDTKSRTVFLINNREEF
ncbi:hypothetical protein [Shewanella sp. Iso12]|uniref:hypothetical protein n=1 Tax=Shewanella sp. Iso12 TaxID=1826753 RepID=UPI001431C646|nr:hypothetical protein [Shewanella sp. Iso12]NJI86960.1 hypothetical protein [Shewanella sp. Iso12]